MSLKKLLIFCIFFLNTLYPHGSYKFEGLFKEPDNDKLFLISFFLPFNPKIVLLNSDKHQIEECLERWPKCTFLESDQEGNCDLLWIASKGKELDLLKNQKNKLKNISVIFTSTINSGLNYKSLSSFLEKAGFQLLSHWYWEEGAGKAIFVRKDVFEAVMRVLNYVPSAIAFSSHFVSPDNLRQLFYEAQNKLTLNHIDQIDFIYMINLDERPEKFALASNSLQNYGIHPYRFSAVNGWKLPYEIIDRVGVKLSSIQLKKNFMGSIYKKVEEHEYLSNEFLQADGRTYFALGMSRGSIGIVLSHLSVLQDAYDSGYETIWVMEDDVEPIEDPWQIPNAIRNLDHLVDEWDILFTDTDTKDRAGNHVPCRGLAFRPNFNIAPLSSFLEKFYPLNSELSRIGMRYGAYSMIIRRSGMKKILDYYKTYGIFLPYDMDFWLIPDIKMYSVNKDIVSHRAGAQTDNHAPGYEH